MGNKKWWYRRNLQGLDLDMHLRILQPLNEDQ